MIRLCSATCQSVNNTRVTAALLRTVQGCFPWLQERLSGLGPILYCFRGKHRQCHGTSRRDTRKVWQLENRGINMALWSQNYWIPAGKECNFRSKYTTLLESVQILLKFKQWEKENAVLKDSALLNTRMK